MTDDENLFLKYLLEIHDPYESYKDFYLGEMATVNTSLNRNMRIQVNPDPRRIGVPYFKVFNSAKPKEGETKVARLDFLDNHMQYHGDYYIDWAVTSSDVKNIRSYLNELYSENPDYTNWQMTKWLWNLEYFADIFVKSYIDDYMTGKFDDEMKSDKRYPSYVPSSTDIQKSWIYDPKKANKKKPHKGKHSFVGGNIDDI